MVVTLRDVAQAAGVSSATASRALDPKASADPKTRVRVRRAADRLGYSGNSVARTLRTSRSQTIGLLVPDVRNSFFTDLAYAVDKTAAEAGFTVMMGNADEDGAAQDRYLEALVRHQVDGLLVVPQGEASDTLRRAVARQPTVCLDRDPGLGLPVVASESRSGMHELVDHIVALGHRRIAVVSGPLATSTGRDRLAAARERLAHHGLLLPEEYVVEGDFQPASGAAAARRLLAAAGVPQVVIAADAAMGQGVLAVLRSRGLAVGADVGVAAFDDNPWFEMLDPPVTAVAQDTQELGRRAVHALLDGIDGRPMGTRLVPTRLVVRRSLGEPAQNPTSRPTKELTHE